MSAMPLQDDLRVFTVVARRASFSAAAQELGASPAYVSKRIRVLEQALGTPLLSRTTRRVTVTEAGEAVYRHALEVLEAMDQLVQAAGSGRREPRGLLRVCSSLGFGRRVVAPALSALVERHPGLSVRFEVVDRLVDPAAEGFDLDVRIGDEIAPHLVAHRLLDNHRLLCAAPAYLARAGQPRTPQDLAQHDCLVIKERDHPFGVWRLLGPGGAVASVKVTGPLSTNHGEVAVQWALEGRGVVLRSRWDVADELTAGRLQPVLPAWQQAASVWAVTPQRPTQSAKVRVAVQFLQQWLARPR
ncbi:MAG: LysR family transcriptional regulator [Burkholderiales bacterium]|nr:LysR family transcriptional regulator [Burkholderiales bacterium]